MRKLFCSVIIAAAGKGKRMNADIPKQYMNIKGVPVIARTIEKFECSDCINEIIIIARHEDIDYCKKEIIEKFNFQKVSAVIMGGDERQDSVFEGIKAVNKNADIVLIHDGARPFVKKEHIEKIVEEADIFGGCVLGVRVKDTVKVCDESGYVCETPERKALWIAQTPQAFKYDIIKRAYEKARVDGFVGTDDSMLAERVGYKVKMTEGDYDNIKITTPEDLRFGVAILEE